MESEGSLPCSQKPATGPYPVPAESSSPRRPYLPKVHLNVIFPPTPRSSQWSLTFGPPNQNPVNTSPLPHACHMSRPPHPPWFNHPNNIRWRIQAVKFIIMQFSPWTIFLPFRSKYLPQHSVLKNPQSTFIPQSERPSFAPVQHNRQNCSFVYFNLQVFWYETGRKTRSYMYKVRGEIHITFGGLITGCFGSDINPTWVIINSFHVAA
jgi:hypothetical protein